MEQYEDLGDLLYQAGVPNFRVAAWIGSGDDYKKGKLALEALKIIELRKWRQDYEIVHNLHSEL